MIRATSAIAALALVFLQPYPSTHANTTLPNFVIFYVDDLGWTNTSVQMDPNEPFSKSDYYQTPNLERLASEGMRFSNAYSPAPNCSPSRTSLFTGMSPAQNHQTDVISAMFLTTYYENTYTGLPTTPPVPFPLLNEFTTIPEHLKQHIPSYTTALLRKDHTGNRPEHYGFDLFDHFLTGYEVPGEDPYKVFATANRAEHYMDEKVQAGTPFFLTIAANAIHLPYEYTTASYAEALATTPGIRHTRPDTYAAIKDLDTSIGTVLDKIDSLGIADNTYIFFASDNGGEYGFGDTDHNAPLTRNKGSIFEGGIRVPMIMKGPGIQANSVSDVPVIGTDLFATVSELAGITAPLDSNLESASLVPLLHNGGVLPAGTILQRGYGTDGELFFHFPHYNSISKPGSAVRDGNYKLIRIYGTGADPEKIYLFDLSASITESEDVNSPLNLASSMPAKTAELLSKLDGWLTTVDAAQPYNLSDDVHLNWRAESPGDYPSLWRTTNRVQSLRRETWEIVPNHPYSWPLTGEEQVTHVNAKPHQPGLGDKAYSFDGNDRLIRPPLGVSDEENSHQNGDNSVSLEFWMKLGEMNPSSGKVLLESGDEDAGISITLGDADSDGKSNDLRFRVLGENGQSMTSTVPVDAYADPLSDFIHVTAVLSDVDTDRYIAVYINGALAEKIDGIDGTGSRLDWDNPADAAVGRVGENFGGYSGTGDLPFFGGFVGQISEMDFHTYAISDSDVVDNYNAMLNPAGFGILSVTGQATIPASRPSNVSLDNIESSSLMVVQERNDVADATINVDAKVAGGTIDFIPGSIAAGTEFTSYLLQFDPASNNGGIEEAVVGTIEFSQAILAIIYDPNSLAGTDGTLGAIGNYGLMADRGMVLEVDDILSVSPDGKTLSFDLDIPGDELLQLRVITEQLMGDFDNDLDVDALDFLAWQRDTSLGSLSNWEANYGLTLFSDAATVPEPSGLVMVMAAVSLGLFRRPR